MAADIYWLISLLMLCCLALTRLWRLHQAPSRAAATRVQRLLKPRTPVDCPACRRQLRAATAHVPPRPPPRPWCEVKSRRGAPKRINTAGFACPKRTCAYYGITDAQVHALVGDGAHGQRERIQTFTQGVPGQACGVTVSARRQTPLYRLKTGSPQVGLVLTALAEGLTIAAAARVFGHSAQTITRWVTRAGAHSARLHHRWFQQLHLPHLQLDELCTRLRDRTHVLWLWLVVDPLHKLIPVLHLDARTQDAAQHVVHTLRQQVAADCLPVFTSDGLNLYCYALTAHIGQWVEVTGQRKRQWQVLAGLIYGQAGTLWVKTYRRRTVIGVRHMMRCGTREALRTALTQVGLSGRLNTAFVERVNLTIRCCVAALARRTWATAQLAPHLLAQLEWWRA